MEGTVFENMISIACDITTNPDFRKGLLAAKEMYNTSVYYDQNDWEDLTEQEKYAEVETFLNNSDEEIIDEEIAIESSTDIYAGSSLDDTIAAYQTRIAELESQDLTYV